MPEQAELLWKYTEEQGMKIEYAEFMNEPNMLNGMCLPDGYTLDDYGRDYDLFANGCVKIIRRPNWSDLVPLKMSAALQRAEWQLCCLEPRIL